MMDRDYLIFLGLALLGGLIGGIIAYYNLSRPRYVATPYGLKPVRNKETWEWVDWRGRKRTITVYREVKM